MIDDAALLRRYAEGRAEDAFAELVRRHVNFVYACAVRRVGGDAHLAEDVTQQVFTTVAREAAALARREVLSGWLYTTARHAAAQVVRGERRRLAREQEAQIMNELTATAAHDAEWARLRPVIDEAMDDLREEDREAVLLRFFEGKSFGEIGAKLRLSENTARMRVERALVTLHGRLAQRGVTSTAVALGAVLAGQAGMAGMAAPAGLAASVTSGALAGAGGATGWGALVGFMSANKSMVGVGVVVFAGMGVAWVEVGKAREERAELAVVESRQGALSAKQSELEGRVQEAVRRGRAAEDENSRLLAAVQPLRAAVSAAPDVEPEPITAEVVLARYRRAQERMPAGDAAGALEDLRWCYDVGTPEMVRMLGVRWEGVLPLMAKLGEGYPPALAVLEERREQARRKMMASERDLRAVQDFAAINRALRDPAGNLAVFDQLSPGDRRRQPLASSVYDHLVEQRRYKDAAEGQPYAVMSLNFESSTKERALPVDTPNLAEVRRKNRDDTVAKTAKAIEVLAGTGDLVRARELAGRLLGFDPTERTRALIRQHAERAGQPGLLGSNPQP